MEMKSFHLHTRCSPTNGELDPLPKEPDSEVVVVDLLSKEVDSEVVVVVVVFVLLTNAADSAVRAVAVFSRFIAVLFGLIASCVSFAGCIRYNISKHRLISNTKSMV
jgi:hypothetical protein